MSRESIYDIACEMLRNTNVFNKDISEIKYNSNKEDSEEVSLLELIKNSAKPDWRYSGKTPNNLTLAYNHIATGMADYLDNYPAVFSFKQRTKLLFKSWLERISQTYSISPAIIPTELLVNRNEMETGIALLKVLHSRDGVTYADIREDLDIDQRAIEKDLIRLSPSLHPNPSNIPNTYAPLRFAGQPIYAKISLVDKTAKGQKKRFFTRNSVHPIALLENLMQATTLLRALCHEYHDHNSTISLYIAIDIWSQLSTYAQTKIIDNFTINDSQFSNFIEILEDTCPDDHVITFQTESNMAMDIELSIDEKLDLVTKAPDRKCTILLNNGKCIVVTDVHKDWDENHLTFYRALDTLNNGVLFYKKQISEIIMH